MTEKLSFSLIKNGNQVISEPQVIYEKDNFVITFVIENINYLVDCNPQRKYFCRYNDEFSFTIEEKNDIKSMNYKLIKEQYELPLNFKYLIFEIGEELIEIKYCLETDEVESQIIINKEGN